MMKCFPRLLFSSLLFVAIPLLAQVKEDTAGTKAAESSSEYMRMTEKDRAGFIANYAGNVGWMLSPERPLAVTAEGVQLIKRWVDAYAARVARPGPGLGGEALAKVFERAVQHAPTINSEFEKEKVLETLGNALALMETEFQPCPTTKTKGKGMFALVPSPMLGVKAEELCEVEKSAGAAARLLKARQAEFAKDGVSAALALLAYARGTAAVKRDFAALLKEEDSGAQLWTMLAKPDAKKFDKAFLEEGVHYLPKLFAAAIVAESPETFGLKAFPLSTYAPQKK